MLIKWGALVVDGRGKLGGHVATKNRAGSVLRTKVTPLNPQTVAQHNARNRFSGLSSAWRALEAAQRASWNSAVSDYASTNTFGDLKNPSGFNLFQMLNNNLLNIGKAQIDVPAAPDAVQALVALSIAPFHDDDSLIITFTDAIEADMSFIVQATPAISAGKSFVAPLYRQIAVMVTTDSSPHTISDEYNAVFGSMGPENMQVFLKMFAINWATGQAGIPLAASEIIGGMPE